MALLKSIGMMYDGDRSKFQNSSDFAATYISVKIQIPVLFQPTYYYTHYSMRTFRLQPAIAL